MYQHVIDIRLWRGPWNVYGL